MADLVTLMRWAAQAAGYIDSDQSREKKKKNFRKGKTQRDHHSGRHARCIENKAKRASWGLNELGPATQGNFPYDTCNGKKNRTLITTGPNEQKRLQITVHPSMR